MKKEEVPQDQSALTGITREICYVKDNNGKYVIDLSTGWQIKKEALENAWDDIKIRTEAAREAVKNGEKSPVFYFMELKLMDFAVLSGYTGFWIISIKRHIKPNVFRKLNEEKLSIYAKAFDITIEELKNFKG